MEWTEDKHLLAENELQLRINALIRVLIKLKVQDPNHMDRPIGEVVNDLNWAITMAHSVYAQTERCQHLYEEYLLKRYEDREELDEKTPF